jgi:hypothetical protein
MTETGSMRTFLLMASCLVSSASGMYIDVDRDNFKCESRSVKAELTYLCNPDTICTVNGKTEYIEGTCTSYSRLSCIWPSPVVSSEFPHWICPHFHFSIYVFWFFNTTHLQMIIQCRIMDYRMRMGRPMKTPLSWMLMRIFTC